MNSLVTLDDNEWEIVDKKLGIFIHKHWKNIIRARDGVFDLDAVWFIKKSNKCKYHKNENVGFRKINKFPYQPITKKVYLTDGVDYTANELFNMCKFVVNFDYEYLDMPIKIDNIIQLCLTGK